MSLLGGMQAWVTSAVHDKAVDKVIVLAGSLRRVRTAKKLAVFTTLAVSKELREKLKEVFDLVVLLEHEVPNGLSLDDYAKIQGFSLLIFSKCVYLSPDTLVLKNCDEIFEKYATFAAYGDSKEVDPTVYVYTPSLDHSRALDKIVHYIDVADGRARGNFSKYFNLWMQNHIPNSERLEKRYNLRIDLTNCNSKSMEVDATIVNFAGLHPLDMSEKSLLLIKDQLGFIERHAVENFLQIFAENVKHGIDVSLSMRLDPEPVAVVGLSFRLPGGNNPNEFWDLLVNGREAIQAVPPFRWTREHTPILCKNRNFKAGFLNVPIDEFDAKFFGISPKEAVFLDPQQRLLHEVSWEAMEDAMIDPLKLSGTQTGVFVGSWIHDYKDLAIRCSDVDFFRVYMGNSIASEAARLSHFLGTTGPSIATESGCSSAIVAVHMACNSLRKRETNLALACGVNLLIHPMEQSTLSFVVAPDGRCKTFDADADGFGRAEACAVLLLKRYSDAVKDGDNIWGLIRGSAVTQEGLSKSLGTPTVQCESLAMELALKDANINPNDVSFVEAHGTGTSVGDPMEVAAITKAYSKKRQEPLIIGSVKTNVGHTESVSGITGIIKVLLSMKNEIIPPHLNLKTINPEINLDAIPAQIPFSPTPWPRDERKPRIAGVSSFGISGTDGHAIIQESPNLPTQNIDFGMERPLHIMKVTAKCQESLDELLRKYQTIFSENADNNSKRDFADMAYSANFGRSTFNHRAVLVASNFTEALKTVQERKYKQADVQTCGNQLCFLFTGQGSQYPNMAATLYKTSPIFKNYFDKCSEILQNRYGISINNVLWGDPNDGSELSRTLYSQTSIFCVEFCLLKLWESWGVKPDYVMGHSLGEFAAAVAAKALTFDDALMLVAERSKLIDSLPRGKMLVIKADKKTVDQTIQKYKEAHPEFWVDYAALNSPDQTVVAGDSNLIEGFSKYCGEKQLKTIVLASTHAFHSRHMDPMLEAYRKVALSLKRPSGSSKDAPKYISGMEGKLVEAEEIDAEYWVRHTREKVSFIDACKVAQSEGCNLFLEIGPHPVLSALTMMNIEGQSVTCLPSLRRKEEDWTTMLESLSKLFLSEWKGEIDWKAFDSYYQRKRVSIPFYQFNRKSVWIKFRSALGDLHPLLGKVVPNASGVSVFEQDITVKKADFAPDHVIGNTIVFPGAAFLEMCLVGGHSCVQGFGDNFLHPRRAVLLKGLKIKAPLALHDSQLCVLQTVVALDDKDEEEMGYEVNIYRLDSSDSSAGGQWVSHASAKFLPVVPFLPAEICEIDIGTIQQSWEKTDNKDFYEKLPEVGLRFGPKFQSLQAGWRSETGVLLQVKVPENTAAYVIHPVVADAMIQAAMLWGSKEKLKKKLQVPVQVGEFTWLDRFDETVEHYIYCSNKADGVVYSLLINGNGTPIAYISGIDFMETTVKLIEGMIHQQAAAMPQLWEEVWKSRVGPMEKRIVPTSTDPITSELSQKFAVHNQLSDEELEYHAMVCTKTKLYFMDTLYKLGWNPETGHQFTVGSLLESLSIQSKLEKFVSYFLKLLLDCGYLKTQDDGCSFFVSITYPSSEEITKLLNESVKPSYAERAEYRLVAELGNHLHEIFTGKSEPLMYLFPTDPSKPHAQEFYDAVALFTNDIFRDVNASYFIPNLRKFTVPANIEMKELSNKLNEKSILRILEVGGGTGTFSKGYLDGLADYNLEHLEVEYCFTDISAAFFGPAEKMLKDHLKNVVFKKFNMEEDPFQQGFVPEYFDVIIACEVLHVAKEIRPMLQRLRSLLKPFGCLQIYETVSPDPMITFTFGLLDGYWHFQDFDLRPHHITLTPEKWVNTLKSTGFWDVTCVNTYNNVHCFMLAQASGDDVGSICCKNFIGQPEYSWLIFSDGSEFADSLAKRFTHINRKVQMVTRPTELTEESVKDFVKCSIDAASEGVKRLEGILYMWGMPMTSSRRDQTYISLPLISLCQNVLLTMDKLPKVCVLTQGINSINGSEVINPSPGTLIGIVRAIRNENVTFRISHIDLPINEPVFKNIDETFYDLWAENDGVVAFNQGKRVSPRIVSWRLSNDYLQLPSGCDRFQLALPETRLISDLEFTYLDPYVLKENEIEVQVKTMALNFRDVFCVLKPLPIFEEMNTVGLDFAGVVARVGPGVTNAKVGDRVIGMNMSNNLSLPSHIKIDEKLVAHLPENMTFNEGVTLPAVFSTAVYCLVNVAKMKRGDTILIHTASGGVGLCAIQLAKQIGANIIATAGSTRKRTYLHNLGIEHVFNSRTTDFGKQILEVTNGKGVDIVLNSITGEGFKEASLDALAKNGRFIEMSKLNVWKDEEVKEMRPDIFYRVVDLTSLERPQYEELSETLKEYLKETSIRPIPFERFDALNVRGALKYLQKAKHIGKIVCVMPEVKVERSKLITTTPFFNEDSTYLVTGGLGGIGFEVVKWMLNNGAKHIAIASRSSPTSDISSHIEEWNKKGKHVEAFAVDVGNYDKCRELFDDLRESTRKFPPVRGVMHAAGVLQDAFLENQTWEKFALTYNAKVKGTWNLHDLTKDMLLEHFVLFSSIAAVFGSPGQTNHSGSNSFEDAFCNFRQSIGLTCISVNWGNWGEVGVATEVDLSGVRPISTKQGILALETFLKIQKSHTVVLNIESFGMLTKLIPGLKTYVDDKRLLGEAKCHTMINADEFWAQVDAAGNRDEKVDVFKSFIKSTIKVTLKMDEDEQIDDNADFQDLGIDSLMMLEMKNALQNTLGSRVTLTATQLKDCNNTTALADRLVDILEGDNDAEVSLPTKDELRELVREDSSLPENICVGKSLETKNETTIETVLLTGVTGTLGPYLLRDLSVRPQIKKIYCLIRKFGKSTASERLHARLEKINLINDIDMEKVECIQGDISYKRLGLSEEVYSKLAKEVDAICHSAVRADHTAKYWKAPLSKKNNIRTVNVFGTIHVLEFATFEKLKHVYHGSTLLTAQTLDDEDCISEDWQSVEVVDDVLHLNAGYPLSKFIAEQLMKQAVDRGIPVKAFRFPLIAGDSKTGRCDFEMNHAVLRWLAYMKLGCMPDIPTPLSLLPVDHCAQLSLNIFFNPQAVSDVYHICRPEATMEQSIIEVASHFNLRVEPVPFEEFFEKIKLEDENSPLSHFKKSYDDEGSTYYKNFEDPSSSKLIKFIENSQNFYRSRKLLQLIPDYTDNLELIHVIMKRDLQYMKDCGVFEKFGITH